MMIKRTHLKLILFLATICGHAQLSQATPLVSDSLSYRGAVFTLDSGWVEDRYLVTYRADFSGFQGDADQAYIKAIDWNWVEGGIDSVELKSAPGHSTDWTPSNTSKSAWAMPWAAELAPARTRYAPNTLAVERDFRPLTQLKT